MPEPIMLSQIKNTVDLRGLLKYAKEKGVKVSQLTEKEKNVVCKIIKATSNNF